MRSEAPITVALGQLGCLIGEGLLRVLGAEKGLRVVGAGLDRAALLGVVARGEAQVVVLDEDSVAGPAVPGAMRDARADVGLVVVAHRPTRAYATRIVSFGVTVCLSTDTSAAEIVRGVRMAADGRHVFVSMSARPARAARAAGISALTRREREVLELLGKGRPNAEIARALQISTGTARIHVKHIYRKLGVNSRGELLGVWE